MHLIDFVEEDIVNYKKTSMFLATCTCSFKCGIENCQNRELANLKNIGVKDEDIIERYLANDMTEAIVIGGLEPFDQFEELINFCKTLNRYHVEDDLVIYTGYEREEIDSQVEQLVALNADRDLIIKFGRYDPTKATEKFNHTLGVKLASYNQYTVLFYKHYNNDFQKGEQKYE